VCSSDLSANTFRFTFSVFFRFGECGQPVPIGVTGDTIFRGRRERKGRRFFRERRFPVLVSGSSFNTLSKDGGNEAVFPTTGTLRRGVYVFTDKR
jgi:hypothetical protein